MIKTNALIVFFLIAVAVVLSLMRRRAPLPPPEQPEQHITEGFGLLGKPTLWWFVDNDTNSRHWVDFGARNSRAPNRGYLELALKKLQDTQGDVYVIKPLFGRKETLAEINGANHRALALPPDLWRSYVISNLCAQKGGLVVDGNSTLFISKLEALRAPAAMFGIYPDEPVVSPMTAVAAGPAPYVGWAATKQHPSWTHAAQQYNALVDAGQQAWGAASARRMFLEVWQTQKQLGAVAIRGIDGSRRNNGTKLQLEDVFGKTLLDLPKETVYITYDGSDLERRHEYNWFLRMSPKQILESSCAWCIIASK
jgi:hypothetical protein